MIGYSNRAWARTIGPTIDSEIRGSANISYIGYYAVVDLLGGLLSHLMFLKSVVESISRGSPSLRFCVAVSVNKMGRWVAGKSLLYSCQPDAVSHFFTHDSISFWSSSLRYLQFGQRILFGVASKVIRCPSFLKSLYSTTSLSLFPGSIYCAFQRVVKACRTAILHEFVLPER